MLCQTLCRMFSFFFLLWSSYCCQYILVAWFSYKTLSPSFSFSPFQSFLLPLYFLFFYIALLLSTWSRSDFSFSRIILSSSHERHLFSPDSFSWRENEKRKREKQGTDRKTERESLEFPWLLLCLSYVSFLLLLLIHVLTVTHLKSMPFLVWHSFFRLFPAPPPVTLTISLHFNWYIDLGPEQTNRPGDAA